MFSRLPVVRRPPIATVPAFSTSSNHKPTQFHYHTPLTIPDAFPRSFREDLAVAAAIGYQCGAVARNRQRTADTARSVTQKDDGSLVTDVDTMVNEMAVQALRARFPHDRIVAEESGDVMAEESITSNGRVWFVDPIDGTSEYIAGINEWSVLIGLSVNGRPALGVVYEPMTDTMYCGAVGGDGNNEKSLAFRVKNQGSTPEPIHVSTIGSMAEARILISRSHHHPVVDQFIECSGIQTTPIRCGSLGVKAVRIAAGEAELYINCGGYSSMWDTCASEAIVRAAGGCMVPVINDFDWRHLSSDGERILYEGVWNTGSRLKFPFLLCPKSLAPEIMSACQKIWSHFQIPPLDAIRDVNAPSRS